MTRRQLVDIHSHVVPGVDDGAATDDEAVAMLEAAADGDTAEIVATPHSNSVYRFDLGTTKKKAGELQLRMGDRIRLSYGCELHLSLDNVEDAVRHPSKYGINGYRYVLVEISNFAVPLSMLPAFEALLGAGLVPILAHPERNIVVQARIDVLRPLVESGVLMQLTASAVSQRTSRQMIDNGYAHVVASDAHNTSSRPPGLSWACEKVESEYGSDAADALFRRNPAAIVRGAALE